MCFRCAKIIVSVLLGFCLWQQSVRAQEALEYPQAGIMSEKGINHVRAWNSMSSTKNWQYVGNTENYHCKSYHPKVSIGELRQWLVFDVDDLQRMTAQKQADYGPASVYFESCNYFHYDSFLSLVVDRWFNGKWGWLEHEPFTWQDSDAYIDNEYTLLLVRFLDKDSNAALDTRQVEALFIRKDRQFGSNHRERAGFLSNLVGSKGFAELIKSLLF